MRGLYSAHSDGVDRYCAYSDGVGTVEQAAAGTAGQENRTHIAAGTEPLSVRLSGVPNRLARPGLAPQGAWQAWRP